MQKQLLVLIIALFFLAYACQPPKDVDFEKTQVEIAMPLFHAEMSIVDVLENTQDSTAVTVFPDNKISFSYEGEVVKSTPSDLLGEVPEFDIPLVDTLVEIPFSFLTNVQISEAQIKSGKLHFTFTNDVTPGDVVCVFSVPQLTINSQPLEKHFTFTSPNQVHKDSFDLQGYDLDLASGSLTLKYSAKDNNGNNVSLPLGADKKFFSLKGIVFGYVEGHWNRVDYNFEERTIEINFFENNLVNGEIYFDQPIVEFTVLNSFGLPTRTKLNYFRVVDIDGSVVHMNSQELSDGINFIYPSTLEIGEVKKTQFTFDKYNSNIHQILNTNPARVEYDIDVIVNPDNDPDLFGFSTDSSYFSLSARVELPLVGKVNHFTFEKDYDFDFGVTDAEEAVLKIATDNEVPLEVAIQMYFLDGTGTVLDSLHNADFAVILEAADYPLTTAKHSENEFSLNPQRWDKIKNTKKIRVKGNFVTSQDGQQIVTFYANQVVNIKAGLKLKLK